MTGRLVAVANGRLLGNITRDARGQLSFAYDAAWREDDRAYPLFLSMPLTAAGHDHDRIERWLWGLLPDNENVLARWARRFQVSARSPFSLLSATGEDCPGAVQFAENEHLCLQLARSLSVPAALSRVSRFGRETVIVVERYDRIAAAERLVRMHQEDICQALARSPFDKYESEGGPGCRDIAGAIRSHFTRPGDDLRTFAKAVALNWVIGGTDAHARNFSVLIGAGGNARLVPLYDLASALPYPGHYSPRLKLAMKVGGEARLGYIRVRHWERFATDVGLPPEEVLGICHTVAAEVPDRFAEIAKAARSKGLDHAVVDRLEGALVSTPGLA